MRLFAWCVSVVAFALIAHRLVLPSAAVADDGKDGDVGHGYTRKAGNIYFKGQRIDEAGRHDIDRFAKAVGHTLTLCKDVDAATFVALSEEYAKDKKKVYYKWISPGRFWVVELRDAHPATFAVLDFNLAKDAKRVWKGDRIIDGADPGTATVVKAHWTWKDRNRVYYQGIVIAGADTATFKHLGQGFSRDAKQVWWCTDPLSGADPNSFEAFGDDSPYARDQNHVWSGKDILEGVEAKSFELIHDHIYKDAKHVYVGTAAQPVLQADPASIMKVVKLGTGPYELLKDRSRHYVYIPSYSEVYALELKGEAVLIWKSVWLSRAGLAKREHGATVSARLQGGVLSEPELILEPTFKGEKLPVWEIDKLKRLKPIMVEAQKQLTK